jgi:hypothetical protein
MLCVPSWRAAPSADAMNNFCHPASSTNAARKQMAQQCGLRATNLILNFISLLAGIAAPFMLYKASRSSCRRRRRQGSCSLPGHSCLCHLPQASSSTRSNKHPSSKLLTMYLCHQAALRHCNPGLRPSLPLPRPSLPFPAPRGQRC